ncbi:odorant receptor 4-like [Microplitis demolitor]|uniref:odorant receptor 4-like n=1 Tax=Microplitis demolitor TaxID=69319 RepID=UPI00235B70B8|nr:odorant receptor 4-like [Microplitis demolitor]
MTFVIVPALYHLFYYEKDYRVKIALFGPIGVCIACALKYLAVIYRRKEIIKCFNELEKDWTKINNDTERDLLFKNIQKGNKVTVYFAMFMFGGGISHQAAAPFLPGTPLSLVRNSTDKPLVFPTSMFNNIFDTQIMSIYVLIYISHILMGAVVCIMTVGTCNLGAIFVTHLCGQIQIMIFRIKALLNTNSDMKNDYSQKQIIQIVILHNRVITLSQNIQSILNEVCFVEILASTIIICVDEYYCMMVWRHNEMVGFAIYFTLLIAFISSVLIFCYIGELLKEQGEKIGQSVYMANWYLLPSKTAREFILIIGMTQHPGKITAGGLIELSCYGFTSVLKTSVAYFNIMRMVEL